MRWFRDYTIAHLRGVPITAHVSLIFLLPVACLIAKEVATGLTAFIAFFLLLTVHELGHALVAWNRECRVLRIGLYPLHGVCVYEASASTTSTVLIAWGGVLVQATLFAACVLGAKLLEPSSVALPPALATALFVLVPVNVLMAATNLLPFPPLDGAIAWKIVPLAWSRFRQRIGRRRLKTAQESPAEVVSLALYRASKGKQPDDE